MKRLLCVALLATIATIVIVGCERDAAPAAPTAKPVEAPAAEAAPAEPAPDALAEPQTDDAVADTADAVGQTPSLRIALLDGGDYDLASRRGRWVVLNFWATWCKPCLKEMPDLDAFDAARDDVEVVGLAYEEIEPQDMRAFLKRRPVKYAIAIVDVYDPPPAFGTPRGLPMTYVIAPDGRVARRFLGPVTSADLEAAISGYPGKPEAGAEKDSAPKASATHSDAKSG